jgi:NAD(P)-dependent dehydrogenase (short-subunit alcohol dehydrogenase family)
VPDRPAMPSPGAIVTGGAGGIGLAVAGRLAADGYQVLALDSSRPALALAAEALAQAAEPAGGAGKLEFAHVDVRDTEALVSAVDAGMRAMRRPTVLCACAGVKPSIDIGSVAASTWDDVFAVNVRGAFYAAQAAWPHLAPARGSIIFTGSASAHGDFENPLYGASKAALTGLARSLAQTLLGSGVRVNLVTPGFTRTGMAAALSEDRLAAAARRNVAGRVNECADVAAAVAWLAGPEAATVSGALLDVGCAAGVPARFGPLTT